MILNIIVEPSYCGTYWCKQYLDGIRTEADKQNIILNEIFNEDLSSLKYENNNTRKICLLIGTSISWIPQMLSRLNQLNIHVILVAYNNDIENGIQVSSVTADYRKTTENLVSYLMLCDRNRIALFGVNPDSSNDKTKRNAFLSVARDNKSFYKEKDVFFNKGSLKQTCQDFYQNIDDYNSVICVNDISAIILIRFLAEHHIKVPDDIYIVAFGDTVLGKLQYPGITTAVLNCTEVGKQAVNVFVILNKNKHLSYISTTVNCEIKVRKSTDNKHVSGSFNLMFNNNNFEPVFFYKDPDVAEIFKIEECLSFCDELDLKIIAGLIQNRKYCEISEQLYITESALKYRIKKILSFAGGISREDLISLIKKYIDPKSLNYIIE